jgi:hypothetical protein
MTNDLFFYPLFCGLAGTRFNTIADPLRRKGKEKKLYQSPPILLTPKCFLYDLRMRDRRKGTCHSNYEQSVGDSTGAGREGGGGGGGGGVGSAGGVFSPTSAISSTAS